MNALKWVGIVAAIWFAAAVMVAVFWHRFKKAQPSVPYDGEEGDSRVIDLGDW